MFKWRNNIPFKNDTKKVVSLQMKGSTQVIVKFMTGKILRTLRCLINGEGDVY